MTNFPAVNPETSLFMSARQRAVQIASLLASSQLLPALQLAQESLAQQICNVDICNLAGVCAVNLGQHQLAEQYWQQALALDPKAAQACFNLGRMYSAQKRYADAEQAYRQAIACDPGNIDAYCNLGLVLMRRGHVLEAEACYRNAIALAPQHADAYANLGMLLALVKRAGEAEACYRQALALAPDDAQVHSNLGALLASVRRYDEAERCYRDAIALDPADAGTHSNLGVLLAKRMLLADAQQCHLHALSLDPANARAFCNLGLVLEQQKFYPQAEQCYRKAIALEPGHAEVHSNLANLLVELQRDEEAEYYYRQAIELTPDAAVAHSNLGVLMVSRKREAEGEACFLQALALDPDYALAHLNLGFLMLYQGRFDEGWVHHESRYDAGLPDEVPFPRNMCCPQWRGEALEGKSVLIWPEQGLGDEIQFCRFAPLLKARGAVRVTMVCKTPLKSLMQSVAGVDTVLALGEVDVPPLHDYWTLPLSIPLHCRTGLDTIPAVLPYLHVQAALVTRWAQRLPQGGFKVGLVWRGNPAHGNDAKRSLASLTMLASLWSVPGVHFVSLQKGAAEDEAAHPPADQPLTHLGAEVRDFADTAAVVAQLDLMICVDTSTAHLAGALNKPCWIMVPHKTDWRWMDARTDSPWYPGAVRLFRQTYRAEWGEVIDQIRAALQETVAAHAASGLQDDMRGTIR